MGGNSFTFRQFVVRQDMCAMKVGTDGVLLGAWAVGGHRILDVGTGTGLIAMMMAQRNPQSSIVAVDIDHDACLQAEANISAGGFDGRISVVNDRLQDYDTACKFDCIVSNPPFFVDSLMCPDRQRMLARHAAQLSCADLFDGVSRLLSADGVFSVIIPMDNAEQFIAEGSLKGMFVVRRCDVRTVSHKPPRRVLLSFSRNLSVRQPFAEAVLQEADGSRSEWYRTLTRDFYIK